MQHGIIKTKTAGEKRKKVVRQGRDEVMGDWSKSLCTADVERACVELSI